jgi:hypothetical protein
MQKFIQILKIEGKLAEIKQMEESNIKAMIQVDRFFFRKIVKIKENLIYEGIRCQLQ